MEDSSLEPPEEFTCPISSLLMADPVIVSTGHTFERECILACVDLGFTPSLLFPYLDLSAISKPSSLPLFPNINLKTAILNWCTKTGFPKPFPITQVAAREIVHGLIAREMIPAAESQPSSTTTRENMPSSSHSRQPSLELIPEGTQVAMNNSSLEDNFLVKLIDTEPGEQIVALVSLREATRENQERRCSLCTSRILGMLRRLLLSRNAAMQINAAAALVNLSLEPSNKITMVRAEVVPPLVELLTHGSSELRDHAAGAIYSLAVEEKNRVAIGVLGAIPPLLKLFATTSEGVRARQDAGMGLYYLTLDELNRSKIARVRGIARTLLEMTTDEAEVRRPALMVLANVAECKEGREALIDCRAVEVLVGLMRDDEVAPGSIEEENCLRAMRWLSRASIRFRSMARAAGAEVVLRQVEESTVNGPRKEYASRTLRSIAGEEDDGSPRSMCDSGDGVVMVSFSDTSPFGQLYNEHHKLAKLKSAQF